MHSELDRKGRLERRTALGLLCVLTACVARFAPAYLAGAEPIGDDASSHVLAAARLAEQLAAGSPGWWLADLNLGFPLAHFYQPLPHLGLALVTLALGGPGQAFTAYKLVVLALLVLLPFSTYLGARRLGFARPGALVAALAFAFLSCPRETYGLTARHFLVLGLHTMLWGAVAAPLALSESLRWLRGEGRLWVATLLFCWLFASHGLLALGTIPVLTFAAILAGGPQPLRRRLGRLALLGLASAIGLSWWLLPQLACSDYFGGWPFSDPLRRDGTGLQALLADLLRGRLTDFHRGVGAVGLLALLGIVAALRRVRAAPLERTVLFGVVLFVVFTAGRRSFGPLVDWIFPPNTRIEGMLRWVAMLQLFLALAAGLGGDACARFLARPRWPSPLLLVGMPLLGLGLPRYWKDLAMGLETFFEARDREAFGAVAAALAEAEPPGRVYAGKETGHGDHWSMAALPLLSGKPGTLSIGVGVQDSLNLYYLAHFRILDRERGAAWARLFDVRYVWHRPGLDLASLGAEFVARRGPYRLVRLPGDYGIFEVVGEPRPIPSMPPVEARRPFLHWMLEGYPKGARFLRLPEPIRVRPPRLPRPNRAFEHAAGEPLEFTADPGGHGRVLAEHAALARYDARLEVASDEAWVVAKVTPHPFWHAEVDGEPVPLYHLSPAFLGLPVEPGVHELVLEFRAPAWQKALAALAPLALAALAWGEQRRARSAASP